jgi:hypothetical protein
LRLSLCAIRAVLRKREFSELGIDAGRKCAEAIPVKMAFLIEFNGNATYRDIPMSDVHREVIENTAQHSVYPMDFLSEVSLDGVPIQKSTLLNPDTISGVREQPFQIVLAGSQLDLSC